jgi:hypothetical protein
VLGIWVALAGSVLTFGSVLIRRPLTGLLWNALHGGTHAWRADRVVVRAHDIATLAAAAVLGARFVVQQWLYLADTTGGLAVARVAMGPPLTLLAALVVIWAFRRTTKRLVTRSCRCVPASRREGGRGSSGGVLLEPTITPARTHQS